MKFWRRWNLQTDKWVISQLISYTNINSYGAHQGNYFATGTQPKNSNLIIYGPLKIKLL